MAAIDYSCQYTIIGPDGATVSFNNEDDENFCGYLDTITGLDCAEVRENAQNNVAGSGGMHDNFYAGRIPWSFAGTIQPSILSNAKQELIQRAVNKALQTDGTLLWTPTGESIERMLYYRCQQPTRMSGRVPKTFQISAVAADYRLWSANINSEIVYQASGEAPSDKLSITVNNQGNADADVQFVINGPFNANKLIISNETTGKKIQFLPGVIGNPSGDGLSSTDFIYATTRLKTFDTDTGYQVSLDYYTDQYPYIDPLNTDWSIAVAPGENTFNLFVEGAGDALSLTVQWRDSWI
jgi:hypothetical protein